MNKETFLGHTVKVVKNYSKKQLAHYRVQRQLAAAPPLQPGHYPVAVYFGDGVENLYQIRQWYGVLRELDRESPVLIIARRPGAVPSLQNESGLAVTYRPRVTDLEQLITEQPLQAVLYVNQNMSNFQMLRYNTCWHVFLNHGESDKIYMTTNQHKAYDYAFVAGKAAQERLAAALKNYDVTARTVPVGRPPVDSLTGTDPHPDSPLKTVLYAPTWEGDRPAAAYSSVVSHGTEIITGLLASGEYRVVYRPHPRTGVVDPAYAAADKRLRELVTTAAAANPAAGHTVDTAPSLDWQLRQPELVIADVSAIVYDRLATGKPVLVTRPTSAAADMPETGFLAEQPLLAAVETAHIAETVGEMLSDPERIAAQQAWSEHYFGDTSPGSQSRRFLAAVRELLAS